MYLNNIEIPIAFEIKYDSKLIIWFDCFKSGTT